MALKPVVHRIVNSVLLKPFGLKLSFQVGSDAVQDMTALLDGTTVKAIIDGGAYEGIFSRRMAAVFPGAAIHAFEPTPASFWLLEEHTRGLKTVARHRVALGATSGAAQFFENTSPLTNSLKKVTQFSRRDFAKLVAERGEAVVEVISLADFAAHEGLASVDVVKLDLQGGELDAIVGLGTLIETVKAILVEVQFTRLYEGAPLFSDIETRLRSEGMTFFQFYDLVRSPRDGRLLYGDALFVRLDLLASK